MIKNFFDENKIEYKEKISLKKYNTYRVDTICDYLVYPKNVEELKHIINELKTNKIKYMVLGNGSNVIFSMEEYNGVIIKLDYLNEINYIDESTVTVEAGCSLIKLSMDTIAKGYESLSFAAGIPGTVGASTAMNAGAYNCSMSDIVKEVTVLNEKLEIEIIKKEDISYSYRDSFFKHHPEYIVLSTTLELKKGDANIIKEQVETRRIKRTQSQPLEMPNAGSVFRNPESMYAGELIEKCNLKGYHIGDAEVSEKHANFIVNKGNATGKEIIELIEKIKEEVKKNYNVDLKLEQIIIK